MQEVYNDGTTGQERDFDKDEMLRLLSEKNSQIDHFRVFEKEKGNKVGLPQIEEKKLEDLIDKKLDEREKRKEMLAEYERLKAEFDKKRKE